MFQRIREFKLWTSLIGGVAFGFAWNLVSAGPAGGGLPVCLDCFQGRGVELDAFYCLFNITGESARPQLCAIFSPSMSLVSHCVSTGFGHDFRPLQVLDDK